MEAKAKRRRLAGPQSSRGVKVSTTVTASQHARLCAAAALRRQTIGQLVGEAVALAIRGVAVSDRGRGGADHSGGEPVEGSVRPVAGPVGE